MRIHCPRAYYPGRVLMAEHQVMSYGYSHNSYWHDFVSHPNAQAEARATPTDACAGTKPTLWPVASSAVLGCWRPRPVPWPPSDRPPPPPWALDEDAWHSDGHRGKGSCLALRGHGTACGPTHDAGPSSTPPREGRHAAQPSLRPHPTPLGPCPRSRRRDASHTPAHRSQRGPAHDPRPAAGAGGHHDHLTPLTVPALPPLARTGPSCGTGGSPPAVWGRA
jgi:hypothetical protein